MTSSGTIADALAAGRQRIAPLEARLLLEAVVNRPTAWLFTHDQDPLKEEQWAQYQAYLERAAAGEPIPYITGRKWFYGRPFIVTPDVLIPRPETEELVEKVLAAAAAFQRPHIVDVGTGSGCIAVTLGCEIAIKGTTISAVDLSTKALAIARKNWRQLAPTNPNARLAFGESDLLAEVAAPIHILVANLPYITDAEFESLQPSVREFEPAKALRGGPNGLAIIDRLLEQAGGKMAPGGTILLEIGWEQGAAAQDLARTYFPGAQVDCLKDLSSRDRFIEVKLQ